MNYFKDSSKIILIVTIIVDSIVDSKTIAEIFAGIMTYQSFLIQFFYLIILCCHMKDCS